MLTRLPKHCFIARSFGKNAKEARRQLPIWRKNVGRTIGADQTVHLLHNKFGWHIILCNPDYRGKK